MNLFREGYSVIPAAAPGAFRVLRPASRGGGHYIVYAVEDRCNCAARVRCRHRIGLRALVMDTATALEDAGEFTRAACLLDAWASTLRQKMATERRAA